VVHAVDSRSLSRHQKKTGDQDLKVQSLTEAIELGSQASSHTLLVGVFLGAVSDLAGTARPLSNNLVRPRSLPPARHASTSSTASQPQNPMRTHDLRAPMTPVMMPAPMDGAIPLFTQRTRTYKVLVRLGASAKDEVTLR